MITLQVDRAISLDIYSLNSLSRYTSISRSWWELRRGPLEIRFKARSQRLDTSTAGLVFILHLQQLNHYFFSVHITRSENIWLNIAGVESLPSDRSAPDQTRHPSTNPSHLQSWLAGFYLPTSFTTLESGSTHSSHRIQYTILRNALQKYPGA